MKSSKQRAKTIVKKAVAKGIRSIGTIRNYRSCVKLYFDWCLINDVPTERYSDLANLNAYLFEKSEIYQQKSLDQHRMGLNFCYGKKIPFVKSLLETVLGSRSYTLTEVLLIVKCVTERNSISILLCFMCGLRAHELLTIERLGEKGRTQTRVWSEELFLALENFTIYVTTGKGGLTRYIAVPNKLAAIIESRRLTTPKMVRDRDINYAMKYDLGFGQALSQCFTRASKKYLGFSTGLHGLRHAYAKNRIEMLLKFGLTKIEAKLIVSQEIGHFRPGIVNCYLR
jgi:integrase